MWRVARITVLASLAALLVAAAGHAQESELSNHALPSDLVPGEPRFDLLLPPAYDPERAEPYPLLLWLHGGGNGVGQAPAAAPSLISNAPGTKERSSTSWPSLRSQVQLLLHRLEGRREAVGRPSSSRNCCPTSAGEYNVAQDRAGTVLGGGSAGGQGTLRIGLRNPEMFAAAAALEPGFPPVASFADLDLTPYGPGAMRFLHERFGDPFDVEYWRARHPPTIVIDSADRLRASGLKLLVEAGDEDANLTYLSAELRPPAALRRRDPARIPPDPGGRPHRALGPTALGERARLLPAGPASRRAGPGGRATTWPGPNRAAATRPRVPNQLDFEHRRLPQPAALKIERLELHHVKSPLPAPLHVAAQPGHGQTHNELTFVRMTTDDGVVGESAGMTLGRFHAGLGDALGPFILGRDPLDIEGFGSVLDAGEALGIRLAWLEPALWDIAGKVNGQPVVRSCWAAAGTNSGRTHRPPSFDRPTSAPRTSSN